MLFRSKNLPAFIGRSFFGTLGILCNFYAVDHLVLSDASILNKLSPFFAILFSYFILKEKLTLVQGSAVAAAFCGAILVVKPGFAGANVLIPSLVGVTGGMCAAHSPLQNRVLPPGSHHRMPLQLDVYKRQLPEHLGKK